MNFLTLLLLLFSSLSFAQAQTRELQIQLKNNDSLELQTKEQLQKLISTYDLNKWMFTDKIIIESGFKAVPHSHPVLTLNTRHLKDNELLLSTFIHEQLHWFIDTHPAKEDALGQLRQLFANPEIKFPEGSGGEIDTYYHILICHLEYRGLKQLLGELKAYQIVSFWQQDHYRWIYKTVLENQRQLDDLVRKNKLFP
ncbi:MAG TPA: hypothetical protein VGD22_04345 [Sphingobacteriaceae bacterium]